MRETYKHPMITTNIKHQLLIYAYLECGSISGEPATEGVGSPEETPEN